MEVGVPPGFRVKKIVKRDGRVVDFDPSRIANAIRKAMLSVNQYDEGVLRRVVEYILRVIDEKFGAEKIPHVEDVQDIVELALVKFDLYEVAKAYILYRKERERIRKEKMLLLNRDYVDEVDKKFSLNAIRLLAARYLLKDEEGRVIEGPKQMFQRVAMLVVIPDILHDPRVFDREAGQRVKPMENFSPAKWEGRVGLGRTGDGKFLVTWNRYHLERMKALYDELNQQGKMKVSWSEFFQMLLNGEFDSYYENFRRYYDIMVEKKFMPNSPTLFNAGTRLGQLSACFVLDIDDNIESIMEAAKEAAIIFKTGGGIGINYSKLRPEGDIVSSTHGVASGPVSFMRIIDTVTEVVKQGGRRRGANMGILEIWHPDIEKFITSKSKPGVLTNFNISVMITPDFWEYFKEDKPYPLVNPRDRSVWKHIRPRQIFRTIAEMAWKTGDPGVLFMDNINKRNILRKALGDIRATNPCVSGDTRILTPEGWVSARELYEKARREGVVKGVAIDEELLGEGGEPVAYKTRLITTIGSLEVYKTVKGETLKLLVPREVDAWVWYLGKKPAVKVVTHEGYEITVTHDHKFLTPEGWKRAQDLRQGEKIALARLHPYYIDTVKGGVQLDEDVAFALGWLVGDGTFNEHYAAWYFSEGDEAAEARVRIGVEKLGGNPLSHTYVVSKSEHKVQYNRGTRVYKNLLKLLGATIGRSPERSVPEVVWKLSPRALAAFLRGLFTADGYVDGDRAVRLTSSSIRLLKDVQVLLSIFGINSVIYERPYEREFRYVDKDGGHRTYRSAGYYELVIKGYSRRLFKELIGFEDVKKMERLSLGKTKRDEVWAVVSKVEDAGLTDFYDFTVPMHHNYIANGLLNHNCGEEPLYPYESCNLGSINLYAFVRFGSDGRAYFDWEDYRKTIRIALRFLDNVIDVNKFPFEKIEKVTKLSRKVGLGLMGLADTLFALKIPYNSEEGFEFMRRVAENLTYYALDESSELARERGVFPHYWKSGYVDGEMPVEGYYRRELWTLDWDRLVEKIRRFGVRNAEVTTIAPTGSISMIVDTSSGIEPQFALVYEKRVTVGQFFYVDYELERQLKERGLYDERILKEIADNGGSLQELEGIPEDMKRVFLVAYDIPWWDHVRAQAEISLWICAAVSKTINMPNWVTPDDVEKAYLFAYRLGLKGITIYRDGSKNVQVLVTPSQRKGGYVLEISNRTLDIMRELGVEPPKMTKKFENEAQVLAKATMGIVSQIKAARRMEEVKNDVETCPNCGSTRIIYEEDCVKCLDCGWVACIVA